MPPLPTRSFRALGALILSLSACHGPLAEGPEERDPHVAATGCTGKCDGAATESLAALPTGSFATLFAPYEPALGMDLALIEEVVRARVADPQSYEEGENPYRIRYAVYNLRNPAIVNALADAEDSGVDVQILIEKDQLDPARDWNTSDELLQARGFELVGDHRDLDDASRRSADLIGIAGSGLMHLKARIYSWRLASGEPTQRLVTGSMNPGDLAVNNDETLHYLDQPALIEQYEAKYRALRDDESITNSWQDGAPLQVLFSPDGGVQAIDKIIELITAEEEAIFLALYSVRNIAADDGTTLVQALADAHARGVFVALITDRKQSDGVDSEGQPLYFNDNSEELLRAEGIPVLELINPASQFNAMHSKYGIFGLSSPVVVTDAGNWTRAGLGNGTLAPRNDESVLFIDSLALDEGVTARRYLGNFVEILRRYRDAPNRHLHQLGGVELDALVGEILALPGWPQVEVELSALVEAYFGQEVFATGSRDVLGNWTADHLGVTLSTDAASYPLWQGGSPPLPLASRSEFKLIKAQGGAVEWEAGGNRVLVADPTSYGNVGIVPQLERFGLALRWR